jgi:hypothetical protein
MSVVTAQLGYVGTAVAGCVARATASGGGAQRMRLATVHVEHVAPVVARRSPLAAASNGGTVRMGIGTAELAPVRVPRRVTLATAAEARRA